MGIHNTFLIYIKWAKLCTVKLFYVTRSLTLLCIGRAKWTGVATTSTSFLEIVQN